MTVAYTTTWGMTPGAGATITPRSACYGTPRAYIAS